MVFLPRDPNERRTCETIFENIVVEEGQKFLGWRSVPTDNASLGATARAGEPCIQQAFIRRNPRLADDMAFERKLYVIRKRAERAIRYSGGQGRALVLRLQPFLPHAGLQGDAADRADGRVFPRPARTRRWRARWRWSIPASAPTPFPVGTAPIPIATSPTTARSTPCAATSTGCTPARPCSQSDLFGDDIKKLLPVINTDGSDSAMFDNCLELLVMAGRSLPHAVMMMIPEPWANHDTMSDEKKAFYEYHSCLMEPWDGPASIAFTDGKKIGAVLDRNGLRPSRYYVTKDDLVIMASEVGVLDVPPERVLQKGRLQPGRMFLVDTEEGRIVADEEIKREIATEQPYGNGSTDTCSSWTTVPDAAACARAVPPNRAAAPAGLRLHLRGLAHHHGPDGPRRGRSGRLHGHATRRWRCCPTSRNCSTIISSSSSPR